jgi:hypothetical protein
VGPGNASDNHDWWSRQIHDEYVADSNTYYADHGTEPKVFRFSNLKSLNFTEWKEWLTKEKTGREQDQEVHSVWKAPTAAFSTLQARFSTEARVRVQGTTVLVTGLTGAPVVRVYDSRGRLLGTGRAVAGVARVIMPRHCTGAGCRVVSVAGRSSRALALGIDAPTPPTK